MRENAYKQGFCPSKETSEDRQKAAASLQVTLGGEAKKADYMIFEVFLYPTRENKEAKRNRDNVIPRDDHVPE